MRVLACLALTTLCGCGDSTVAVCVGDPTFCSQFFRLVANPGPDQTVASGDLVTLDGSNSDGGVRSYSWTQTGGPTIALTNAGDARATFVAPWVPTATALTFQLTVVDDAYRADARFTRVTVRPPVSVALARAVELLAGPLQPASVATQPSSDAACPSATLDLAPAEAAAQIGLWLGARTFAIARGVDRDDPSAFFDAARGLIAERPVTHDVAGQIEALGFALLGGLATERDPGLRDTILELRNSALMPREANGLLMGRYEVRDTAGITIEAVDPVLGMQRAVTGLLSSRGGCIDAAHALELTAASLRVITASAPPPIDE